MCRSCSRSSSDSVTVGLIEHGGSEWGTTWKRFQDEAANLHIISHVNSLYYCNHGWIFIYLFIFPLYHPLECPFSPTCTAAILTVSGRNRACFELCAVLCETCK